MMDAVTLSQDATLIDAADIRARFQEDPDLMREILDLFLTDYPERLAAMHAAIDRNDAADLRLQAHSLKGSAAAIGANQVAAAAAAVESLARTSALAEARPACITVEEQLVQIAPILTTLIEVDATGVAAA